MLPELVGKWCAITNVDAKDGGRQSGTCFTLKADGTYDYHLETTPPVPIADDRGHWAATATSLVTRSTHGTVTTHRLAKRNHPRTHDPMLVIDGQTFVTFFQHAPW